MPSQRIKGLIRLRDDSLCYHCGSDQTTLHHRRNRGMGGQKPSIADRPSNLLTMCPEFNALMESDSDARQLSIDKGWKLLAGQQSEQTPVWRYDNTWWMLDDDGKLHPMEQESLF